MYVVKAVIVFLCVSFVSFFVFFCLFCVCVPPFSLGGGRFVNEQVILLSSLLLS